MGLMTPTKPEPEREFTLHETWANVPVVKLKGLPYADIGSNQLVHISFETKEIRYYFEGIWFKNVLLGEDNGLPLFIPSGFHFKLIIHDYGNGNTVISRAKICRTIYNCLVLNDDIGEHWATRMEQGLKTIETRFKAFKYRGDLIICCGNKSMTRNKGLAVCITEFYETMPMTAEHEEKAMIAAVPGRVAHLTRNLRHFSRKFEFSKRRVSGSFQGIFQITLPDDVYII